MNVNYPGMEVKITTHQPLLSICIPTFNRNEYIEELLNNVISQVTCYKDEVEVLVSDNHSYMSCENIVKNISERFQISIKFYYQEENIGGESNFAFLINESKGKYLHILGDDDLYAPYLYSCLIPSLKLKDYGLICLNSLCIDLNNKLGIHMPIRSFAGIISEMSAQEFIKHTISRHGLISNIIINRVVWETGYKYRSPRYFLFQALSTELYGILETKLLCLSIDMPMVIQRCGQKHSFIGEYFDSLILGLLNLYKDLDKQVPGLYYNFKKNISDLSFINTMYPVVYNKKHYRKTKNQYKEHFGLVGMLGLNFWLYMPGAKYFKYILMPTIWFFKTIKEKAKLFKNDKFK